MAWHDDVQKTVGWFQQTRGKIYQVLWNSERSTNLFCGCGGFSDPIENITDDDDVLGMVSFSIWFIVGF